MQIPFIPSPHTSQDFLVSPTIPQRAFLQTHYSPVRVLLYMRSEARLGIPAGGRR